VLFRWRGRLVALLFLGGKQYEANPCKGDVGMKKLKLMALLSLGVLVSGVMVACKNNDDKILDPGGEFAYDTVSVGLSDASASIDKVWAPSDFPGFAFSKIDNGFYANDVYYKFDDGYLVFHLTEPSRENVLRAIYYLKQRPEIKSAEVNSFGKPQPIAGVN